eukprot:88201-Pelagomonas_calceolata.AAC.1
MWMWVTGASTQHSKQNTHVGCGGRSTRQQTKHACGLRRPPQHKQAKSACRSQGLPHNTASKTHMWVAGAASPVGATLGPARCAGRLMLIIISTTTIASTFAQKLLVDLQPRGLILYRPQ